MRSTPSPGIRPDRPGRRVLLAGGLGAVALALSGCRVRLEDDAPPIPFIPTREPIAAESALMWLLLDSRDLATSEPLGSTLYSEQVAVLRSALYRAGIPIGTLDTALTPPPEVSPTTPTGTGTIPSTSAPPTSPVQDPTGSPTTGTEPPSEATPDQTPEATTTPDPSTPPSQPTPTAAPRDGAVAALRRIDALEQCGPGLFPLIVSMLSQRWAAVQTGGAEVPDLARVPDPAHRWQYPHLAASFVDLSRAAVYGLQVAAAQSREERRDTALLALNTIRALTEEQTVRAAGQVSSQPIAYPLPFPVNSAQSAHQLATHVLRGLIDGYGGLLTTVTGSAQRDTARDVIGWIGTAATIGTDWDIPLEAFPGLRAPN